MEEEDDTQWSWNVECCLSLEMMTLVKIRKCKDHLIYFFSSF